MIGKEKVTSEVTRENISGVTCDWCGKEFGDIEVKCEGYGRVDITFGYGSIHDGDVYKAEICDDCFEKIFSKKARKVTSSR
jgi:hypothetical protein